MISWDYIAGFFDGEGTITKYGKRTRLAISQTSFPVLNELRGFTRVGTIVKVAKRQKHWKDAWVYSVVAQAEVYAFLQQILPYLIVKKRRAERAIVELRSLLTQYKEQKQRRALIHSRVHSLRNQGLTYREIGKRLHIDWGYARRIKTGER